MLLKYILPALLFFVLNVERSFQSVPHTHTERGQETPHYDQLILFVNSKSPTINTDDLDALKKLSEEIGADLKVKDVIDGAPQEVTYTPSVVFQNSEGRSFYYGRYKKTSFVHHGLLIRAVRIM